MKGYFFNAVETNDLETYPTGYDRNYDAEDFAEFYKGFFSDGILIKNSGGECLVAASGATLTIKAGFAVIEGHGIVVEGNESVAAGSGGYAVIRLNKSVDVRAVQFLVVSTLVKTNSICDLELAKVTVTGGVAKVTDTRSYVAYTGNVTAVDNVLNDVEEANKVAKTAYDRVDAAHEKANAAMSAATYYGKCFTGPTDRNKVVDCPNFTLAVGARIAVTFMTALVANDPRLDVNGTGAILIYRDDSSPVSDGEWVSGATIEFVYDGIYWRMFS